MKSPVVGPGFMECRGSTKRGRRAVEAFVRYELPADSRSWKGVVGRNPREIRSEIGGKTRSWVKEYGWKWDGMFSIITSFWNVMF